jgi:putative SOS response-associated peptidase YedK
MRDGRVFAFAGLWDRWDSPDEGVIETCAILTISANAVLAPIHDRMPVILPRTEYARWLDPALLDTDSLASLLAPSPPEDMLVFATLKLSHFSPFDTRKLSHPGLSPRMVLEDVTSFGLGGRKGCSTWWTWNTSAN